MDGKCPEMESGPECYGLILRDHIYQGVFEYTVEERWDPGKRVEQDLSGNEKVFFRTLPLRSLFPVLFFALCVSLFSMAVWSGELINLSVSRAAVFDSAEVWRLLTALFQHGDAKHLLNNMLPFVGIGWLLWGYFGTLAFPIVPLLAGALANLFAILTYAPHIQIVGISGAVFAMAGMWVALYIKNDNRYPIGKRVLRALGFLLILFFPLSLDQNVADRVHILGGVIGFCCGYLGWGPLLPQRLSEQRSSARRVRVL